MWRALIGMARRNGEQMSRRKSKHWTIERLEFRYVLDAPTCENEDPGPDGGPLDPECTATLIGGAIGPILDELVSGWVIERESVSGTVFPPSFEIPPGAAGSPQLEQTTLDVVLHVGPVLAANAPALAAFQRAAEFWESVLVDPVVINLDAELASLSAGVI